MNRIVTIFILKQNKIQFMKYIALLIVFFSMSLLLPGQEMAFSLEEAREYAVKNNLTVQNARTDVELAKKKIWETTAIGLPQVSGAVSYTNNLSLATTLIPNFFQGRPDELVEVQFGTQHNASASITANQLLFSGPYIVGLQAARIFREVSERALVQTEVEIRSLISQSYYLILLAEKTRGILASNVENMKNTLRETQAMYEQGFMEETDVDQLQVSLTTLENALRSMERQRQVTTNLLKYQLGVPFDTEVKLTDDLESVMDQQKVSPELNETFSLEDHISYQLLETQEELASMNLKREYSEFMPSVSLFYTNQFNALRDEFNFFSSDEKWYNSAILGLNINVPILSSGSRMSKVSQRKLELEQATRNTEDVSRSLELENIQARTDYRTAWENYSKEISNTELTRKILDKTRIKFKEGMVSSMELTQANDQYLQSQSNLVSASIELLNAKTRLDKILSKL